MYLIFIYKALDKVLIQPRPRADIENLNLIGGAEKVPKNGFKNGLLKLKGKWLGYV